MRVFYELQNSYFPLHLCETSKWREGKRENEDLINVTLTQLSFCKHSRVSLSVSQMVCLHLFSYSWQNQSTGEKSKGPQNSSGFLRLLVKVSVREAAICNNNNQHKGLRGINKPTNGADWHFQLAERTEISFDHTPVGIQASKHCYLRWKMWFASKTEGKQFVFV